MTSGQVAYEAWLNYAVKNFGWSGLNQWNDMGNSQKSAWEAVAKAVEENLTLVSVAENADEERGE